MQITLVKFNKIDMCNKKKRKKEIYKSMIRVYIEKEL